MLFFQYKSVVQVVLTLHCCYNNFVHVILSNFTKLGNFYTAPIELRMDGCKTLFVLQAGYFLSFIFTSSYHWFCYSFFNKYATACSNSVRKLFTVLFSQFLQRQQALSLYRDFLRAIRDIESEPQRAETKIWVRGEFEKWKHTTDEVRVLMSS